MLVTYANHNGMITNSDMGLMASVAQHDVLTQMLGIREVTIHNSLDKMVTVWWNHNGATSNSGPIDHLVGLQALHKRHYLCDPTFDHIVGEANANAMADACSRLWHLNDSQLTAAC
jgi:hypothetical protein